jgi:fructose-1,6-bisphosphatase-3
MRYLQLLSRNYPSIAEASTEIINLEAILNLPKGTEHFLADLHGENEAFLHVLKNASGNIKRKVNDIFGDSLREIEKKELCTLIYYPEQKLELIKTSENDIDDFYHITLHQLVRVCQAVSSKYTRSKVRHALPEEFAYIIEELLHESSAESQNKQKYANVIIDTIITTGRADDFIIALCNLIQRLAIDQLHILGDIFDRGPGAHIIMDTLSEYHNFDMQWGNHDILWIGAAGGNDACIANVLRLSLRYGNMATLEDGYGINLVPLATFAMETYKNDLCSQFGPKLVDENLHDLKTNRLIAQMHKAISVIQFKLEASLIDKHPEWEMGNRKLLHHIDFSRGIFVMDGKDYEMQDCNLPTVKPSDPYALTPEEQKLVEKLHHSFLVSDKLQKHINVLFTHGCMYGIYNSNLLFHASVPLNADGSLKSITIQGKEYKGRELLHKIGMVVREAYNIDSSEKERSYARDYIWYLWCGPDSPLFDKSKMATFERYFLKDEKMYAEEKGNYYKLRDDEKICDMILDAFGVTGDNRHIINGHVPVHATSGENPIKANGKLMVIDGGFAKAFHNTTGIAGYTLVFHSRGFQLVQHEPFASTAEAIKNGTDIKSTTQIVEMSSQRMMVKDTDKGKELIKQVQELSELLYAYRHGYIKEKVK